MAGPRLLKIKGAVALVSGANRGIGRAFVEALRERGAARVYACARQVESLEEVVAGDARITPVTLDVADSFAVQRVANTAGDVSLLVNNAGAMCSSGLVLAPTLDAARREMDVNFFGMLAMVRAFAPVLAANGGGAMVNMLSIAAHISIPGIGSYSASKAAARSLTQGVRAELANQRTLVVGVFPGPVDTDMAVSLSGEKAPPEEVVAKALAAVESGAEEVYPDAYAERLKAKLDDDYGAIEKKLAALTSGR